MNPELAIHFLKVHQPMPNDNELTEELIQQYDEVMTFLQDNPVEECLPLILHSFGEYDGMGVYQLVEDTVAEYPYDKVVSALEKALKSTCNGVRYWCSQIAMNFPDEKLVTPLSFLLADENSDIRNAAIQALSCIKEKSVFPILKHHLEKEYDEENKQFLLNIINEENFGQLL